MVDRIVFSAVLRLYRGCAPISYTNETWDLWRKIQGANLLSFFRSHPLIRFWPFFALLFAPLLSQLSPTFILLSKSKAIKFRPPLRFRDFDTITFHFVDSVCHLIDPDDPLLCITLPSRAFWVPQLLFASPDNRTSCGRLGVQVAAFPCMSLLIVPSLPVYFASDNIPGGM